MKRPNTFILTVSCSIQISILLSLIANYKALVATNSILLDYFISLIVFQLINFALIAYWALRTNTILTEYMEKEKEEELREEIEDSIREEVEEEIRKEMAEKN